MNHYVYRLDDPETGEYYYGSRSCKCLPKEDLYMGSPCKWKPDKSKLVKTIILEGFPNREEALQYERELILVHINEPLNRNYNIPGRTFYYIAFGEKNHFYGKKHTIKSRLKMSMVDRAGENNSMWGKHFSEESKQKMREKKIGVYDGAKNPRARKLYQYDTNGNLLKIWDCAVDCIRNYESEGIKLSRGNISSRAKNNSKENNRLLRLSGFIFAFTEINIERFNAKNEIILVR